MFEWQTDWFSCFLRSYSSTLLFNSIYFVYCTWFDQLDLNHYWVFEPIFFSIDSIVDVYVHSVVQFQSTCAVIVISHIEIFVCAMNLVRFFFVRWFWVHFWCLKDTTIDSFAMWFEWFFVCVIFFAGQIIQTVHRLLKFLLWEWNCLVWNLMNLVLFDFPFILFNQCEWE